MSDLRYTRCSTDDWKSGVAAIGLNTKTGEMVEMDFHSVNAAVGVHSALITLTAAMKAGHEDDFLPKIALFLASKLSGDPHCLCPMLELIIMLLNLLKGTASVDFDDDGELLLKYLDQEADEVYPGCLFKEEEEDDDELHEEADGEG